MALEITTYMNPIIASLKKLGGSARANEVCSTIAEDLNLTDEILEKRNKNGGSRFENQVHWARFYLAETGYLDSSIRGVWSLTEKGQNANDFSEDHINRIVQEVRNHTKLQTSKKENETIEKTQSNLVEEAPPDRKEQLYNKQLLTVLKSLSPDGFERICQRLLREAGFEKVVVTGKSGDGGIDGHGVLQINPFVSFRVLFQCKRYDGSVGAPEVRNFRGAMMGRADKGIILSTGSFTAEAKKEAMRDGVPPIELADGERLVEMFVQLELGLKPRTTYDIDESFFEKFMV